MIGSGYGVVLVRRFSSFCRLGIAILPGSANPFDLSTFVGAVFALARKRGEAFGAPPPVHPEFSSSLLQCRAGNGRNTGDVVANHARLVAEETARTGASVDRRSRNRVGDNGIARRTAEGKGI